MAAAFDHHDRRDDRSISADTTNDRIRYMARSGGYVMVRKPRCSPFVLTEKEWARLPLFETALPNHPNTQGKGQ